MVVLTEGARVGEAIMSEGNFHISRENGVVALSQTILRNGLVGRVAVPAAVDVTQSYTGTGNGVLTPANPAVSSKVQDGAYKIRITVAAANAGTFQVERPDGTEIGTGTVGVAFNKEIKFTIADGATDFVVGDEFQFVVAANPEDFQIVAYNPAGSDGSEVPYGYSPYGAVTDGVKTAKIVNLVRECELNGNCIAWPAGITAAQKADAIQALAVQHIIVRY
jgi:hypothetical protein